MGDNLVRDEMVSVRSTEAERSAWTAAAATQSMRVPEWARIILDFRDPGEGQQRDDMTARTGIACTAQQKRSWETKATRSGRDLSEMVRDLLNTAAAEILNEQQQGVAK